MPRRASGELSSRSPLLLEVQASSFNAAGVPKTADGDRTRAISQVSRGGEADVLGRCGWKLI